MTPSICRFCSSPLLYSNPVLMFECGTCEDGELEHRGYECVWRCRKQVKEDQEKDKE